MQTELEWLPLDGVSILEATTNADGEACYDGLIGHPTDFTVLVPRTYLGAE